MTRGRLEAFSDAVIAIVMTIMVLELVPPHGATLEDLLPAAIPVAFVAPLLSLVMYVAVAVMWIVPDTRIERRIGS